MSLTVEGQKEGPLGFAGLLFGLGLAALSNTVAT